MLIVHIHSVVYKMCRATTNVVEVADSLRMCVFALPTWPGGSDNTGHQGEKRGSWGTLTLSDTLSPFFVVNRKWHSSSSAFCPPHLHSLSVFCLFFLVCADYDELDGTVGGRRSGGGTVGWMHVSLCFIVLCSAVIPEILTLWNDSRLRNAWFTVTDFRLNIFFVLKMWFLSSSCGLFYLDKKFCALLQLLLVYSSVISSVIQIIGVFHIWTLDNVGRIRPLAHRRSLFESDAFSHENLVDFCKRWEAWHENLKIIFQHYLDFVLEGLQDQVQVTTRSSDCVRFWFRHLSLTCSSPEKCLHKILLPLTARFPYTVQYVKLELNVDCYSFPGRSPRSFISQLPVNFPEKFMIAF